MIHAPSWAWGFLTGLLCGLLAARRAARRRAGAELRRVRSQRPTAAPWEVGQ